MPNTLDATGLTVETTDEISTDIVAALQAIYGTDINLASNSPDGQMVGIYSQASSDKLDLLVDIYNMFDPDSAYGVGLQRICAINGMALKAGTFTTTPVNVTTNRALNLPGLDQTAVPAYQVQDANNVWTLVSSYTFGAAATQALVFQCAEMGPIQPISNTINVQATPVVGVTAVNNPTTTGTVLGQDEETDVQLRTRRAKSFKLAATCPADAVEAALAAITDVTDALVVEDRTGHTIWCIVVGGTAAEIAAAIYAKAAPGVSLLGGQSLAVVRKNGQTATMKWDNGIAERMYTRFSIIPAVAGVTFDNTLLKQEMAAALVGYFKLGKSASIGDIVRTMYTIEPRAILTSVGVSTDGVSYGDTVSTTTSQYYFTLASGDITIS